MWTKEPQLRKRALRASFVLGFASSGIGGVVALVIFLSVNPGAQQ